ncbi:MAG: type II toxin-antitoxin system PemK/MazF family toxin [Candidatus Entotheonellia bacterium]
MNPNRFKGTQGTGMPGPLQLGRIVWAEIPDANGIRKLRPAIIVTPTDRISSAAPLDVVAVTSRLREPLPYEHILRPWQARGHPRTGVNRRCAAPCTWVARIAHDDIRDVAGVVSGAVMLDILSRVRATFSAPPVFPAQEGEAPSGPPWPHKRIMTDSGGH